MHYALPLTARRVYTLLFSSVALLSISAITYAQGDLFSPSHAVPVARPATSNPDRIILTWVGDPATSQAVTWRSDNSVTTSVAQIVEDTPSPDYASKAKSVSATDTQLTSDIGEAVYHTARFDSLKPDTQYLYRVGSDSHWSEWFEFHTAKNNTAPFKFLYFGDEQNEIKSMVSRVVRKAYATVPDARFIIHAGDLEADAIKDGEWAEWFDAGGWIYSTIPSIPTPGNHEYAKSKGDGGNGAAKASLSYYWQPQFPNPGNGPKGLESSVYYVDYQGVRIISLNSNEQHEYQAKWLKDVLANNPNRWTVVTFHHPVFESTKGRDNVEVRTNWKPLFDQYHVDLVLQGHDHMYGRSGKDAPIYVTSVCGPKSYFIEHREWAKRAAAETQLFQVIAIDGDKLKYEAHTAAGDLYDAFELRKQADRSDKLKETLPSGIPERLQDKTAAATE